MPASCTFRWNRLSIHSKESPGLITISVMSMTSAIVGRSKERDVAPGNRRCNTRVCHRAAEKAPASPPHSSRRWRYTFGVIRIREPCRSLHQRSSLPTIGLLVCGAILWEAARGIGQSPACIKFVLADGKRKGLLAVAAREGLIGQKHLFYSILGLAPLNTLYRADLRRGSPPSDNA
jgi:hypothetical protein